MRTILLAAVLVPVPVLAQVTPGLWETTATVTAVDMPGVPAGVANMMRGHAVKVQSCLTPEQAAKGPQELMKSDKSCRFTRYSMTGGKLSSEMVCTRGGQTMTATTTGTFTATSFTATGRTVATGSQPMTITATSAGRRVGTCK